MLRLLLFGLVLMLVGCDTQPERPLTLAERVAGSWELERVEDGRFTVTQEFEQTVGLVEFEFESVGCCAANAIYRLTVTRPDGEVRETVQRYRVNDNPETPDFFVLFTGRPSESLLFTYDLKSPFNSLTLTMSGVTEALLDALDALEIVYPFEESVVLELKRR